MDIINTKDKTCVASLKLLGDYYILRILNALSDGELRYCDLQRDIDGLNPTTFTGRLKKLEEAHMVERKEASAGCVTYALTALGQEALPVFDAINNFSTKAKALI